MILLLVTACVLFCVGPYHRLTIRAKGPLRVAASVGICFARQDSALPGLVWFQRRAEVRADGSCFKSILSCVYIRGLSLSAGILLMLVLWNQIDDDHSAEAYACLLVILAGTSLVAASNDLVSMFLSLEMVSIPTYVILYLPRRDRSGGEATLKYFLLSVFSSALVLYGMSWLFGVAGIDEFRRHSGSARESPAACGRRTARNCVCVLVAGLCFRIAAVPFHFYAPDVFQGTTAANAALLSFIPKIVGFVALLRLLPLSGATTSVTQLGAGSDAKQLLAVMAVATMFVGNLMALRQKHLYRLMAYSSIAHAGYMLIGLAMGDTLPVGGRKRFCFTWPRMAS